MKQTIPYLGLQFSKIQAGIMCCIFFIFIISPIVIQTIEIDNDKAFLDNRLPSKLPSFPKTKEEALKYKSLFSQFINDNFGLRAKLLKLNILINYKIGHSSMPGLIMGKDGWLFLKNDYAILDQYRGINRFSNQELEQWVKTLDAYRLWLASQNINFLVVVAPNQQTVYSEFMPYYVNKVNSESRLDQVNRYLKKTKSKIDFLDLRDAMIEGKERFTNYRLYNKYEGHWNSLGAFIAYEQIMDSLKKENPRLKKFTINDFNISTYSSNWNMPPLIETHIGFSLKKSNNTINNSNFKVLFYGDSFGDTQLLSFLRLSIPNVVNVNTNWKPFPFDLIINEKPNIVIFQLVERYLARPLN
jgi:hypothetical protein